MSHPHALLLDKMADHVLLSGLTQATLRPLARAAGTSDRMLIYHFGSKEGVISALLDHLAERLTARLEATVIATPASTADLIADLLAQMQHPAVQAYGCIWLEVVANAARDLTAYRDAAARIVAHFQSWIADRLPQDLNPAADRQATAALALAVIEGCVVLGATGPQGAMTAKAAVAGFRAAITDTPEPLR